MTPLLPKIGSFHVVGELLIHDRDSNGVFDPKVDQATSFTGKALNTGAPQVKKALSDLGINTLNGLRLSPARQFVRALQDASYYSKGGDVEQTVKCLTDLKTSATEAGLAYPKDKGEKLLKNALEKGLASKINMAQFLAAAGDVRSTRSNVEKATQYAERLEKDFGVKRSFDEAAADKILNLVYTEAVPRGFENIEFYLQNPSWGDRVEWVEEDLLKIEEYAALAGIAFDEGKAEELRYRAREGAVEFYLDLAETTLTDRIVLKESLAKIREYSEAAGFKADPERLGLLKKYVSLGREIREAEIYASRRDPLAYERLRSLHEGQAALGGYIESRNALRKAVKEGQVDKAEGLFQDSMARAFELKEYHQIDVNWDGEQWLDVYDAAVANAVEKKFADAESIAKGGLVESTENALDDLYDKAMEWGVDIDMERFDAIREQAYVQRLEYTFGTAGLMAHLGYKEACEKALKEAEGYSKELGVPFDKKRASEIRKNIRKHPLPLTSFSDGMRMGGLSGLRMGGKGFGTGMPAIPHPLPGAFGSPGSRLKAQSMNRRFILNVP